MEDQAFLDAIVDGSRARDFEAFERHMALPLTVILPDGTLAVADTADLRTESRATSPRWTARASPATCAWRPR